MELAIDFGASVTDVVKYLNGKFQEHQFFPSSVDVMKQFDREKYKQIYVTGGSSAKMGDGNTTCHVDEIRSIGTGGAKLANLSEAIIVSCGTGTCIVKFKNGICKHLCGTGVGGGSIMGLSKLISGCDDIDQIIRYSNEGKSKSQDISVGDICGGNIGKIDKNMTAANFAKPKSTKTDDQIAGIVRMVAESIIMLASIADNKTNDIIFTGRVSMFPLMQEIAKEFKNTFPVKKYHFPENREFATAIGAFHSRII